MQRCGCFVSRHRVYWPKMFRCITEPIDRWVMGAAADALQSPVGDHCGEAAAAFMQQEEFLTGQVAAASDLSFFNAREFRFSSAIKTPWLENNIVRGKFYRAGAKWRDRPSVVLLHGWNGELGYYLQFPALAWRLARAGVNAAMLE